ncbi:MAG: dihydrofolate reductase family protein [Verrucomicrobia bacterium]|nr:dihydrofolate reductase family protein [Verrucomicrobiota bacterium]
MRKLIESTLVSLDGVVESPENWALSHWNEENRDYAYAYLLESDAFLLGRVTYEKFAATWSQTKGDRYIDRINSMPKFVVSSTLEVATWNATLIKGDVVAEIIKLKSQPGKNLIKYGTSQLDRTLIEHNLIDEFHFLLFPVTVGTGRRLFEGIDASCLKLKLTRTKTFGNGIVSLTYCPG